MRCLIRPTSAVLGCASRVSGVARFGPDSAIEVLASVIIVWRFTGTRTLSATAEARAQKAVAVTFFLLAPYIAYDAVTTLIARDYPETSWLGIGLSAASLIVMPVLGIAKRRLGARLDSRATVGEGTQSLLCAYLAAAVLADLLANTILGWWWLEPHRGARHRRSGRAGGHRSLARPGMRLLKPSARNVPAHRDIKAPSSQIRLR
jgi:hypothetical protein